ncbi:MAG TPA: SCO family protein [Alphaproteobacteria bacterium]|nr:SCO family protein [Alphaproteobacteria bacterium]
MSRRFITFWCTLHFLLNAAAGKPLLGEEIARPSPDALMDALMWGHEPIGGPFELIDHSGARRTDAAFRGKLTLIYFGYTYCPDICPTDLQEMVSVLDLLGADGAAVQPLFITIDPERDTPQHLAEYVQLLHPRLIGLTGEVSEIQKVARAYKAYYAKVIQPDPSSYLMEHSAFIYLVDADGRYLGFFPPGTTAERMAAVIRPHLPPAPQR